MTRLAFILLSASTFAACTSDSVDSNEQARRAYLGLDASIGKSIKLGFDGFNMASSANISPQMVMGTTHGTLTVTGQVDQGASANKGMRLFVGMVGYDDGPFVIDDKNNKIDVVYDTDTATATQPALNMMLKGIPTGTIDGTLAGTYHLTGDIKGDVLLNLTFNGTLMAGPNMTVLRVAGSTTVTGTAVQGDGTYTVMVTL